MTCQPSWIFRGRWVGSGAESIDDLFFTLLLKNTTRVLFDAGNNNLLTGASIPSSFGPDSLTEWRRRLSANRRRSRQAPKAKGSEADQYRGLESWWCRHRSCSETEAELLMGSAQLMIDAQGSPTKIPVDNPHRNKYRIISMPHLSDPYYQGASAAAWYLFANPNVLPAFEIVFLNGRRTPVIERVEMPPNTLGMGFRSYIDFGVNSARSPRGRESHRRVIVPVTLVLL